MHSRQSNLRCGQSPGGQKGGYTLRVVREVRCVFSRRLNVSSVLDSLIAAGNSFQMVGAEKLKDIVIVIVTVIIVIIISIRYLCSD